MKSREERFNEINDKMSQVYEEYLKGCAEDGVEIADVFNTALQAVAKQTSSLILQFSVITGGENAQKQKKIALDICDKHYRSVRRLLPDLLRDAHAHVAEKKGPWE